MLKNTLTQIPKIVLLRSDKILYRLLSALLENRNGDNSLPEIMEGVRDFYPNSYRLDEIELGLSQKVVTQSEIKSDFEFKNFQGLDYNFSFLDEVYDKFLLQDGANIYAREEKLESYLGFISKISPLQIIGYRFASELKEGILSQADIFTFVEAYTPLALKVDRLEEYAENHLHLKGAGYLAFNFIYLHSAVTPKEYYEKSFLQEIPRINEFSFINNHQISIGQLVDIWKLSKDCIYHSFMGCEGEDFKYEESLQKVLVYNRAFGYESRYSMQQLSQMNKIFDIFSTSTQGQLSQEILALYHRGDYSKAYLMEYILIFSIFYETKDSQLSHIIKVYLHASNILRSYMLMS